MRNVVNAMLGDGISIGLSKTGIAVLRIGNWRKNASILADHTLAEDASQAPDRLALQCTTILADAKCKGLPLAITLSDDWVRLFIVTPPRNSGRLQDIQAAAAMRFQTLFGEPLNDWRLEADWDARDPFLACAIPQTLLAALQQVTSNTKLPLLSVMPQFVVAWNRWHRRLRAGTWFGVVLENSLTLGAIAPAKGGHLAAVQVLPIPVEADESRWLPEQVSRMALRLNLQVPPALQLTGNVPQAWISTGSNGTLSVNSLDKPVATSLSPTATPLQVSAPVQLARTGMRA